MKNISKLYFNLFENIKYFYIEFKDNIDETIEVDNHILIKGTESITPGMYIKTMKAMEYINNNYEYDFVVRTNLSTFWNLYNLNNLLNIPYKNFCSGFAPQGFITGTGIILSEDIVKLLVDNFNKENDNIFVHEDVLISQILSGYSLQILNITNYKWGFLVNDETPLPSNCYYVNTSTEFDPYIYVPDDILHFRIKNNNRNLDIEYFRLLLKIIYNIIV
jgi:hypothetical protein